MANLTHTPQARVREMDTVRNLPMKLVQIDKRTGPDSDGEKGNLTKGCKRCMIIEVLKRHDTQKQKKQQPL